MAEEEEEEEENRGPNLNANDGRFGCTRSRETCDSRGKKLELPDSYLVEDNG